MMKWIKKNKEDNMKLVRFDNGDGTLVVTIHWLNNDSFKYFVYNNYQLRQIYLLFTMNLNQILIIFFI